MLTSCAAIVTLLGGAWKEPAGSQLLCSTDGWAVLLTATPQRMVPVHRPPSHTASKASHSGHF